MKPLRVALYGNFGAGNLGNECTLQAVIEKIRERCPEAELLCLCTDPDDVRRRHGIAALSASTRGGVEVAAADTEAAAAVRRSIGLLARLLRVLFRRIPAELAHWVKMLRVVGSMDLLVVAGTGIVADYMCGPLGWPYDMFKLGVVARLTGAKFVFLSVGAGPIDRRLSRFFLKTSLRLAAQRSYRDEASKRYLQSIGFDAARDPVFPDVVFGLGERHLKAPAAALAVRRIVGLGLKDYSGVVGLLETAEYRHYMETMCAFVAWLHAHGYAVRVLIGDFQYDSRVRDEFVALYRSRYPAADPALLIAEPALSVDELLRQLAEIDCVISPRYHNLVMSMIQDKPAMALSDHAKLDALLIELDLARYLVPLAGLDSGALIARFEQFEGESARLKDHIRGRLARYRGAIDTLYASMLPPAAPR